MGKEEGGETSWVRPNASRPPARTLPAPSLAGRLRTSKGPGGSCSCRTNAPLTYTSNVEGVSAAPEVDGSGDCAVQGSSEKSRVIEAPPRVRTPARSPSAPGVTTKVSPAT